MANLNGTAKTTAFTGGSTIITGPARAIPVCINPTAEELSHITKGRMKKTEINSKEFTLLDLWLRVDYDINEEKVTQETDSPAMETFIKMSFFLKGTYQESPNGAWYVNPKTCDTTFKKPLEVAPEGYTKAYSGQKELFDFLSNWLNIIEIDFETPYSELLKGNVKEIAALINENLKLDVPKEVMTMLSARITAGGTYQDIYKRVKAPSHSLAYFVNKVKSDPYFMKDNVISTSLQFYKEDLETTVTELPNASVW